MSASVSKQYHAKAVAVAVGLAGVPWAHAQLNAASVDKAMDRATLQYLRPCFSQELPICETLSTERSQLAPDKLVMLGDAALAASQQQVAIVRLRQLERQAAEPGRLAFAVALPTGLGTSLLAGHGTQAPTGLRAVALRLDGAAAPIDVPGIGLFTRLEGDHERSDPTSFDPGFSRHASAFTAGADYRLTPTAVIGLSLGRSTGNSVLDTRDGTASGQLQSRHNQLSAYASWFPTQQIYVDAIVGNSRGRYQSRRDIPVVSDAALGDTASRENSAALSAGYAAARGRWTFGGQARVAYQRVAIDAFTEQANISGTHLAVAAQSFTSLQGSLGAQASYASSQSWGVLIPTLRLEWIHQYRQDKVATVSANFARIAPALGAPEPINISTTPVDRDHGALDLGVGVHFGLGRSAVLNYSRSLGRAGRSTQALSAEARIEF